MWTTQFRKNSRWWMTAVACVLCTGPVVAYPVLTFTVASHKVPFKNTTSTGNISHPSDETYPLTITLGHQYLIVDKPGTRTIYDFDQRRILQVDLTAKSYTDVSLYLDIGFRAVEFQNRIMLGTALQAVKDAVNPMEPALMEQLFSLSNPKGGAVIDQRHTDGIAEFSWQKQKLMSVSDKTRELPAGYQSEYWRFLRYYAGGHPKIYAALASTQGVPEMVTFVLTNANIETRDMTLEAIRVDVDAPYSLDGFVPAPSVEEPYKTLKLLGPDAVAQLAERAETTSKARDAAFAQGHVLDALLANIALSIMTGDKEAATAWTSQHRDAIQGDASAHSLAANLSPRDTAAAQAAVEVLADLHQHAESMGYMLDVFEGNTRLSLGDGQGGTDHLLSALKLNPYLLGAWSDLAGYYYRGLYADEAWACWDTARRVNPQHLMLLPVTDMENRLRASFPEFF
jgi:hypothetical protein